MSEYDAVVESISAREGTATLRVGKGRLRARPWPGIRRGERRAVRVRPEDVLIALEAPGPVSARNVLAGHVRSIAAAPDGARVTIDAGFPLVALVTRHAREDLDLRRGRAVFALVKATAIVPASAPEARLRFRVSLLGPRGTISPERLDLLRAVDATGSIARAAAALGIAYRTAWTWAEDVNRAWAAPLLVREKGGHGGGGAILTPAGRAIVEATAAREAAIQTSR